ncbi:MAG: EAL domain-containing protein [Bacilli bacterium]|nr:EAL domain-containing protein [Bacilli bacterium]
MTKTNTTFFKILTGGAALFAAYAAACAAGWDTWCNILSTLCSGGAAGILIYAVAKTGQKSPESRAVPFYAAACCSWMTADFLWAASSLAGGNPSDSVWITFFYFLTNVFLFIGILTFLFLKYSRWSSFQLLLDTFAVCVSSLLFIRIVFFKRSDYWVDIMLQDGVMSAAAIAMDFFMVAGLLLMAFSSREEKAPLPVVLLSVGVLLFSVTDLYYYYKATYGLYQPNSFDDLLFLAPLLVVAYGALWKATESPEEAIDIPGILKSGHRWYLLALFPAAAFFAEGFNFGDLLHFFFIIVAYRLFTGQVRLAVKNEELYQKEKGLNTLLEERVQQQYDELLFLAHHDTVTKLYNRRFFMNALEEAVKTRLDREVLAVFLIDVDRFKTFNDTLGHDAGDKILMELSGRMLAGSNGAVTARLGGDEFALLYQGRYSRNDLEKLAIEIIDGCSAPFEYDGQLLKLSISLGISVLPTDADDRTTLMRNADTAMYHAKNQGYNQFVFYDPFFRAGNEKKDIIKEMLQRADLEKDFELRYQPQFNLHSGTITGAEALVCWKSAEHGYISAKEFIPVAEELNYILEIGKRVMLEAVRQVVNWNKTYSLDLKMGLNISPKQLGEGGFLQTIKSLIDHENLNATWIDVEITQDLITENGEKAVAILDYLKKLRVSVSVDGFGTENSDWGQMRQYPFDRVKIHKMLIDNLSAAGGVQAVKAALAAASACGVTAIAEGVETQEQLDTLKELGCEQAQGYLLGRPAPAQLFEELFIKNTI